MDEWPELSASLMRRMVSESVAQETKLVSPGSYEKDREAIAGVLERLDSDVEGLKSRIRRLSFGFYSFAFILLVLIVSFVAYMEGFL